MFISYTYGEPVIGTVRMTTACRRHRYESVNPGCVQFNNTEVRLLYYRVSGTQLGERRGGVGAGVKMRCTLPPLQVSGH